MRLSFHAMLAHVNGMWSPFAPNVVKRRRTQGARSEAWYQAREAGWRKRDVRHAAEVMRPGPVAKPDVSKA